MKNFFSRYKNQVLITGLLALMWLVFSLAAPATFTSFPIYASFMSSIPFIAIVALGMTLVVAAGEMDLSFASNMAMSGFIFALVTKTTGHPLAGVLAGSAFGTGVKGLGDFRSAPPMGTGHCMMALNVEAILGVCVFKERMDALIEELKSSPRAEGVERVYVPGEIEFEIHEKRSREGIPVSPGVVAELEALGASVGLPPVEKRPVSA